MKNRIKGILKTFCLCVLSLSLFGCSKKDDKMYYNLERVDKYLYNISYKDYRYDENLETVTNVEDFGCSSVKNGNFYGRNFDFIFNDIPEFVVRVDKKEKRHASIGVSYLSSIYSDGDITSEYLEKLELLPNFMLDGINDAGVIASINVVPKNDVAPLTGTNPGKENLHIAFIVRYILDNASSADEAVSLLQSKNIYGDMGEEYNLHCMIADANKTYIVEFIDNKLVAQEKTGTDQIMTNYYANLEELTEHAAGVERANILKENYDEGSTFEGMWNLMQRVEYSKEYLFDKESEWYSEFLTQSMIKTMDGNKELQKEVYRQLNEVKKAYWVARGYDKRKPANKDYWFTTHNSIYDISERKLRITIQEKYDKYYEYKLDEK